MKGKPEKDFVKQVTNAQGIVHKVCAVYCTDPEQRKDLFQEILIQLWKSYPSFKSNAKFSTWMYRVSLNVALQYVRKRKRKPVEVELSAALRDLSDQGNEDHYEEELQLLYAAIGQLKDVEKAIIMLYLEDKGNDEIAEIIGISQNYVRVKMNRAKAKLRKILNTR